MKSKKSPLYDFSIKDLKNIRDGIAAKRKITSEHLQEGSRRLVTPWAKPTKERPPPSPLEKAVMSRRPNMEPSDDEDDFPERDWETERSGLMNASADEIINQLYVRLGSIKARNSSIKLRRQVISLLDSLVKNSVISEKPKKEIIGDYIERQ